MSELKVVKCPKCGKSVYDGQMTCHHCGTLIPSFLEMEKQKKEKPKGDK